MARIMIENLFKKAFHVSDYSRTLLEHFQDPGIDWMQACGEKGRCTTCMVSAVKGIENSQKLTSAEQKYRRAGALNNYVL